jgi:uncharacterized protein (DUF362 family)
VLYFITKQIFQDTLIMKNMKSDSDNNLSRRSFLTLGALGTASLLLPWQKLLAQDPAATTLVLVRGGDASRAFQTALEALGGLAQFKPSGHTVVVKPNIGWDRLPEQAANTDPNLVAAAVKAFKSAGATVQVFDNTCNPAPLCYRRSGIEEAAKAAGADISLVREQRFEEVKLPHGVKVKSWPIYRDWLNADFRLNLPILKHHSLAGMTAGLKNLMGIMGGNRSTIHNGFPVKLTDIAAPHLPELTVVDARRVLLRNGPTGGSLDDVKIMDALIAGFDPVAVDAEAARLFGLDPAKVDYLVEAQSRGLGNLERPSGYREISL